jgi:hypothetical protein
MIEMPPPLPTLWLPPKPAIIEPARIAQRRVAMLPGMVMPIASGASTGLPGHRRIDHRRQCRRNRRLELFGAAASEHHHRRAAAAVRLRRRWRRAHRHDAKWLVIAVQRDRRRQRAALLLLP